VGIATSDEASSWVISFQVVSKPQESGTYLEYRSQENCDAPDKPLYDFVLERQRRRKHQQNELQQGCGQAEPNLDQEDLPNN
jgi:hypothetical protein